MPRRDRGQHQEPIALREGRSSPARRRFSKAVVGRLNGLMMSLLLSGR